MEVKRKKILAVSFVAVVAFFLLYSLLVTEKQKILSVPINSWSEDHRADCALVLTGGAGRVREGFNLLSHKSVKKLIISGVHPQANLRDIFPQWPYYGELREIDVILEKRSGTTYGNAQQSLALIEALHCRDIVLVTSRLHMYRALRTFRAVFPDTIPIYPRAILSGNIKPDFIDLSTEIVKSLFYSIWAYPLPLS